MAMVKKSGKVLGKLDRRRQVAALMRANPEMNQRDVAETLGLSQATVSRDVKEIELEWKRQYATDIDAAKCREIAGLYRDLAEAEEGWQKSKKTKQIITRETEENEALVDIDPNTGRKVPAKKNRVRMRIEEPAGDPNFLREKTRIRERIHKLLGLDAPQKINVTHELGRTVAERVLGAVLMTSIIEHPELMQELRTALAEVTNEIAREQGLPVVHTPILQISTEDEPL
jgi:predicted transcriptional regulator